ncbi:MAG: MMPL family transporter, partial [Planctomycetes bacterium]|nr:MMPL family transporter [Planctomycetota bacterium]
MSRRSLFGLVALTVLVAALARFAEGWRPDNRISSWVSRGEGARVLERLGEAYGGDEFLLLRVEHGSDGATLAWADALGNRLAASPAASNVVDPLHLPGSGDALTPAPDRLRTALERPLVRELRLADESNLDFVVALRTDATPAERTELAQLVDEITKEAAESGHRVLAAGHPLVSAALDEEAGRVDRTFAPLLVLLAALLLAILQRSPALALATVLPAALASVGTRAALHAAGWPSNLVLVAVGPLVFVIVLAASLHYAAAFRRALDAGMNASQAARAGLHEVLRASLLAASTTAVGFGVFATSDVEAVRRLGIASALGIAVGTPVALFCLRRVLPGLRVARRTARGGSSLARLAEHAAHRRRAVIGVALLISGAALFGARGLRAGTNALDYFPAGDPLLEAFLELEADHVGLSAVEVLVEGVPPKELARGDLDVRLGEVDPTRPVFGPELVRRDLESVSKATAPLLLGVALQKSGRAATVEPEGARWTVFLPTSDAEETRTLAERAREVAEHAYPGATVRLGGSLLGALDMQSALLATLATSLALTMLVTGLLFLLVTREPREL